MPNNDSVEDFLKGIDAKPKDDPFALEPKEDPLEIPMKEEVKEEEEKPLPFNKDPKVQRFIQKEVQRLAKDLKPTETQTFVREVAAKEDADEVLSSLTEIVGNDTPAKIAAVNRLHKALNSREEASVQRALKELETRSSQEAEAEQKEFTEAQNELTDGFLFLEEKYNVDLLSERGRERRGRLIDFIKRIAPKDEDGEVTQYPDFDETYKLFQSTEKAPSNNRAKDLASRGIARSTEASTVKQGGNSWKDVERMLSKLEN